MKNWILKHIRMTLIALCVVLALLIFHDIVRKWSFDWTAIQPMGQESPK